MKVSNDSDTPAIGQQVITAGAFIHQNFSGQEKVFLAKRSANKKFLPNVFELPGGHINFGEDIVEGLKREIWEELSIKVQVGDPFYVFTYNNEVKGSHSIEVIYFATLLNSKQQIKLNSADHSEFKWLSEDEIMGNSLIKGNGDPECQGILRGFFLLKGNKFNFA